MLNKDTLALIAKHLTIVHHVPGRIRFRVNPGLLRYANDTNFELIISSIEGIENTRLNRTIGSVVVHYDPDRLPPELWVKWIDEAQHEEVYKIVQAQRKL